jgi:methionyl-tRNA formyltransferase
LGSKILKIFWAEVDDTLQSEPPGCVVGVERDGIRVATGKGHIVLKEIQLEGKKRLPVREFLLGQRVDAGTILGSKR